MGASLRVLLIQSRPGLPSLARELASRDMISPETLGRLLGATSWSPLSHVQHPLPQVAALGHVLRRMEGYAAKGSVEIGGFLMGRAFGPDVFLVTALSTIRTGAEKSLQLGPPPKGAVGWFHSGRSRGLSKSEARAHASLFPGTGLFAILADGTVAFFRGKGESLEPVQAVEVNLPLEKARTVESLEDLARAVKGASAREDSGD